MALGTHDSLHVLFDQEWNRDEAHMSLGRICHNYRIQFRQTEYMDKPNAI